MKIIQTDEQARESLLEAARTLDKTVGTTFGSLGGNVILGKKWGVPNVTHDGVTVAKDIEVKDPFINAGIQLIKEAASKTNDSAGDGTTTATILAYHMINEGMKKIYEGTNPMKLRQGMLLASGALSKKILEVSVPIKDKDEVFKIATISAQNEELGSVVAKAIEIVGKDGVINVQVGTGTEVTCTHSEGMAFDKGFASAYFVTNQDKTEAEVGDAYIFITDHQLQTQGDILPILDQAVKKTKNVVIIADNIDGDALAALVVHKMRGSFNVLGIKAPSYGDRRKDLLEDICALTGATFYSKALKKIDNITIEDFGRAEKVWSDKDTTKIVGGKGNKKFIAEKVNQIKDILASVTTDFQKDVLRERLAKISTGVITINVGGKTEAESEEKKERIIDAVAATRAALTEGVIGGGAVIFLHLLPLDIEEKDKDILAGINVVTEAVVKPFQRLMENSGISYFDSIGKVNKHGFGWGIDVLDGLEKDMVKSGIIDPTKVVRAALENATVVASSILTTKVIIVDEPEEKK